MKRQSSTSQKLARQAFELSLSAPQVVAHRVSRMARSGITPSARDRKEFTLMGSEKALAFQQSWAAMWAQAFRSQMQLAMSMSALAGPAMLGRRPNTSSALAAGSNAMLKVMSAGLAPVHTKAMANAKRLARRRK